MHLNVVEDLIKQIMRTLASDTTRGLACKSGAAAAASVAMAHGTMRRSQGQVFLDRTACSGAAQGELGGWWTWEGLIARRLRIEGRAQVFARLQDRLNICRKCVGIQPIDQFGWVTTTMRHTKSMI